MEDEILKAGSGVAQNVGKKILLLETVDYSTTNLFLHTQEFIF